MSYFGVGKRSDTIRLISVVLVAACASTSEITLDTGSENEPEPFYFDEDEDGFKSNVDCNDNDYRFHPGAEELCDGEDNDCDGEIDEGFDADGDGYASAIACGGDDCDDEDDAIHPGATEHPYDGFDQDCDGADLVDVDGDGFAAQEVGGTDCDDTNPSIHPGASDVFDFIDTACDGADELHMSAFGRRVDTRKTGSAAAIVSHGGDVNGDGLDDFLIAGIGDGMSVFYGSKNGDSYAYPRDANHIIRGWSESDLFWKMAGVGDVNGDGYDDVMTSHINRRSTADEIFLFYGSKRGLSATMLSQADVSFTGMHYAPHGVSGVGDVNGDGFDDIVVGLPDFKTSSGHSGSAFLVLGSVRGMASMDVTHGAVEYAGEVAGDGVGTAVAGAGDINGDGFDDMLIGANGYRYFESNYGAVYVLEGGESDPRDMSLAHADATLLGEDKTDAVGDVLSSAGDVNGDGYDDLLIGAPRYQDNTGRVYLVYGSHIGVSDMRLDSADAKITGDYQGQRAGSTVSAAGDVNNDGFDDVMVGANNVYGGAAYVVTGSSTGMGDMNVEMSNAKLAGNLETRVGGVGESLSGAGDVNGDGIDDILFGSYGTGQASAYVLYGFE